MAVLTRPVKHHCHPPAEGRVPIQPSGTVWRCDDCRRRWQVAKVHAGYGPAAYGWVRRLLPWPRG